MLRGGDGKLFSVLSYYYVSVGAENIVYSKNTLLWVTLNLRSLFEAVCASLCGVMVCTVCLLCVQNQGCSAVS